MGNPYATVYYRQAFEEYTTDVESRSRSYDDVAIRVISANTRSKAYDQIMRGSTDSLSRVTVNQSLLDMFKNH